MYYSENDQSSKNIKLILIKRGNAVLLETKIGLIYLFILLSIVQEYIGISKCNFSIKPDFIFGILHIIFRVNYVHN